MIIRNKPRNRSLEHAQRVRSGKKDSFYCSTRWRWLRRVFLAQNPLCADPFGYHAVDRRTVMASEVDHVIPRRERPDLELSVTNMQSLCKPCHTHKSNKERRQN